MDSVENQKLIKATLVSREALLQKRSFNPYWN